MAQISVPRASLLGIPPEILTMIYEELLSDPTTDPYLLYQFLFHTCHEISSSAHPFKALWSCGGTFPLPKRFCEQYVDDWRPEFFSDIFDDMEPLELNLINKLSVDVTGWNAGLEDFEDEDKEYAKVDENGYKFWEIYDVGHTWLIEVLEKFPGVERVDLLSDGHGFMWELDTLVDEIKRDGDIDWEVVECDREADTFRVEFERKCFDVDPSNWLHRKRSVIFWVN